MNAICGLDEMGFGWDRMVIIGQRSSKRTFGVNKDTIFLTSLCPNPNEKKWSKLSQKHKSNLTHSCEYVVDMALFLTSDLAPVTAGRRQQIRQQ